VSINQFSGFPRAGIDFLTNLAANNDRDWFNARKAIYKQQVEAPAQELVSTLGERLQTISPSIIYDTSVNGSGSLMRIYRDTRFSQDKTPYNPYVTMAFWEGPDKKKAYSGFYLRVEPTGVGLMVGTRGFDKDGLAKYRTAVLDNTLGAELDTLNANLRQSGRYELHGEHFKRVPRGFDANHPRAILLRFNSLHAFYFTIDPKQLLSAELVDQCMVQFTEMAPLHHWLVKILSA
jgi:uncharacterized protein (TIGR02453 family)